MTESSPRITANRVILAIIFALGGLSVLFVNTAAYMRQVSQMQGAQTVLGTIDESRMKIEVSDGGGQRESSSYAFSARYSYELGGQAYTGDNAIPDGGDYVGSHGAVQKLVARYTAGAPVLVYYRPWEPLDSWIISEVNVNTYVGIHFSFMFLAVALYFFFYFVRLPEYKSHFVVGAVLLLPTALLSVHGLIALPVLPSFDMTRWLLLLLYAGLIAVVFVIGRSTRRQFYQADKQHD